MIRFYSTRNKQVNATLEEALLKGLAEDGGLFMPTSIPTMPEAFFEASLSFPEISLEVAKVLLQGAIPPADLARIVSTAINFDAPLRPLSEELYVLELFHGPTLSFKDFGARFMAQLMGYFVRQEDRVLNILVATSGDTGSAIAQAFLDVPGIQVYILYPKGKVSWSQEQQLTTMGHNITALEVEGAFDDCQRLVKEAFSDVDLRRKLPLTSANSINIGRLIPQSFYYFYAHAQRKRRDSPLIFSVPSGNFGNLTAGLLAKRMGLPVRKFVAATNVNDSVPRYLRSGVFEPHATAHTLSNAMDVGNPSNFARMLDLYDHDLERMRGDITGARFTDDQTAAAMREAAVRYGYLLDPHGAVAYLGLQAVTEEKGILLETAHPAKFADDVERIVGKKVVIPDRLQQALTKKKQSVALSNSYQELKSLLV